MAEDVRIYIDMDGVLADFEKGIRELCHMEPQSQNGKRSVILDDLMWEAIRKVDHFYGRLDLMPGAKEMFSRIESAYGDKCEILTGIPREERGIVTAAQDKIDWMKRVLSDSVVINVCYRAEKIEKCTGPDAILIDDLRKNIDEWTAAGGTGVLHTDAAATLEELKRLGVL